MKKKAHTALFFSLGWCVLILALLHEYPFLGDTLNHKMYDWKLALARMPDPSPAVVHVDVDDAALTRIGRWPWDRKLSAEIVRRLTGLGARVIAFDILYAGPGPSEEGDRAFFNAIRDAGNVVSATALAVTPDRQYPLVTDNPPIRGDALYDRAWYIAVPKRYSLWKVKSVQDRYLPLPDIIKYSKEVGHIKGVQDADGVHRRIRLLVLLEDRCIPSLTLAALAAYWDLTPQQISLSGDDSIDIRRSGQTTRIPIDSEGRMLIHWGDVWAGFPHYSVTDVLSDIPDKTRASRYKDKIVIVAVTGTGTTDTGVTPRSVDSPLSRIHSHALSTILTGSFIRSVSASPWILFLAVVGTLLFSFVAMGRSWKVAAMVCVAVSALACLAGVVSFVGYAYDVPIAEFLLMFVPAALVSLAIRGITIEMQAARVSRAMVRYISKEVLDRILDSREALDITAKRAELTIVFVDIRGFSTLSETAAVDYVHRFLNEFFLRMTRAIFDHQGTIDKFLGDGLLAFFGHPLALENHAIAALKASIDMQREMAKLSEEWAASGLSEFKEGVQIRIGINTGMVIVGDLGSGRRVEYTVVGSAVNIASRLQSQAPAGGILMTARTRAMIRNALTLPCEGPETIHVKGIGRGIEVYRIDPGSLRP